MSHFCVFVIGDNVEAQLQPYHEFECTGTNDQYVQHVDKMSEYREEYESSTTSRLKSPDGKLYEPWDDRFFRDPTPDEKSKIGMGSGFGSGLSWHSKDWGDGLGYRPKVNYVPDGYQEVDLPESEVKTFANFVEDDYGLPRLTENETPDLDDKHKYGWYRVNAAGEVIEIIDRTNPNAQWDWWEVGGRWSGFLKLKANRQGKLGRKGVMGSCAAEGADRADIASKGDIDIDGMRDQDGEKAGADWDRASRALADAGLDIANGWMTWGQCRSQYDGKIDEARKHYHDQAAVACLNKVFDNPFSGVDRFLVQRDQFVQEARDRAICPYAVVMDSKWYAKGKMGWWGFSHDETDQADWNRKVNELLGDLPDETLITVVDCHT